MNTSFLHQKRVAIPALAAAVVLAAAGSAWAETNDNVRGGSDRDRIAAAAVEAAGGGRAVDVERSDDLGEAYEVEVRQKDGTEIDVALDRNLKVLHRERDDADDPDDRDDADDHDDADDDGDDNDDNPRLDDDQDD